MELVPRMHAIPLDEPVEAFRDSDVRSVAASGSAGPALRVADETDAELDVIVRLVLSHVIADGNAKRPGTAYVCRGLAYYAQARRGGDGDGHTITRTVPLGPWPDARAALRRLGVTQRALHEELERREDAGDPHATLDEEVLVEFFPKPLWPVLQSLILDGPREAKLCAERALRQYARRVVPATKRRAEGPPSRGTVDLMHTAFTRIFKLLAELR
jgi:hypothetical protein